MLGEGKKLTVRKQAVVLMIASALCFSVMQLCSGICSTIPAMEQIFFRNVISIAMYVLVWKKGIPLLGTRAQQPMLLCWSLCGCLNVLCLFIAAKSGDQGSLMIIGRMSGFLVVILSVLLLGERAYPVQYGAVALALLGGVLTASPSGTLWNTPFTLCMALLSSLFSALASICLGMLKNRIHALTVAMHFSVFSLVLSTPFLTVDFVLPTGMQWLALIGIGLSGGLGQLTQMWAYERAPVGEINIYGYSGILFSIVLGCVFLNEKLTWAAGLGGALVILAGVLSYQLVGNDRPHRGRFKEE